MGDESENFVEVLAFRDISKCPQASDVNSVILNSPPGMQGKNTLVQNPESNQCTGTFIDRCLQALQDLSPTGRIHRLHFVCPIDDPQAIA